jgi:hypothetical protein
VAANFESWDVVTGKPPKYGCKRLQSSEWSARLKAVVVGEFSGDGGGCQGGTHALFPFS